MARASKTEGKDGGPVRIMLSLTPAEVRDIDARRGNVPRATFIWDVALRALVERAGRGKGGAK